MWFGSALPLEESHITRGGEFTHGLGTTALKPGRGDPMACSNDWAQATLGKQHFYRNTESKSRERHLYSMLQLARTGTATVVRSQWHVDTEEKKQTKEHGKWSIRCGKAQKRAEYLRTFLIFFFCKKAVHDRTRTALPVTTGYHWQFMTGCRQGQPKQRTTFLVWAEANDQVCFTFLMSVSPKPRKRSCSLRWRLVAM